MLCCSIVELNHTIHSASSLQIYGLLGPSRSLLYWGRQGYEGGLKDQADGPREVCLSGAAGATSHQLCLIFLLPIWADNFLGVVWPNLEFFNICQVILNMAARPTLRSAFALRTARAPTVRPVHPSRTLCTTNRQQLNASSTPASNHAETTERTTHFGYETVPEAQKAEKVAGVFHSVADSYDRMNDLMSFGWHRVWK
jgi:hypothetical protein